jgi:hypothetical protein
MWQHCQSYLTEHDLHQSCIFLPTSITTHHFRTYKYVATLSVIPHKSKYLPLSCYLLLKIREYSASVSSNSKIYTNTFKKIGQLGKNLKQGDIETACSLGKHTFFLFMDVKLARKGVLWQNVTLCKHLLNHTSNKQEHIKIMTISYPW